MTKEQTCEACGKEGGCTGAKKISQCTVGIEAMSDDDHLDRCPECGELDCSGPEECNPMWDTISDSSGCVFADLGIELTGDQRAALDRGENPFHKGEGI